MAIKAILDKTSYDALDANLKTLYKADNGVYVIDADGLDDHPFAKSLKTALDTERGQRTKDKAELEKLRTSLGDLDPAAAREALKRIKEIEEKAALGDIPEKLKEPFEKAVATRTESIKADFETQKKAFNKQLDEAKAVNKKLEASLSELTIDNAVRTEATKMGLNDWAIEDAVLHAKNTYKLVDGKPVPMQGDQIIYGKDANQPKPISEWLADTVARKPGWVKNSTGGGAENQTGVRKEGNTHKINRADARDPGKFRAADAAAKKEGAELQIVD